MTDQRPSIRKAVIPVAGLGTRLLPATKAIPKEMLPLVDKPLIQYVVYEAIAAGLSEIVFVTHPSKHAIEQHFTTHGALEAELTRHGKYQLLNEIKAICPSGVTITSVLQPKADGLGHAVLCARPVVGDEPFAVLLPDVIIDDASCDLSVDNLAAMVALYERTEAAQIMVDPVPKERVDQYGIADVDGDDIAPGESLPLRGLIEKPAVNRATSNLAVVGRYVLPPDIWELLESLPADKEIELTDAIASLIEKRLVEAFHLVGESHDCGNKLGYLKACIAYAIRHPEIGRTLTDHLKALGESLPP